MVTIVGSARSSCSALHSRLSIPLRFASQLFSYPVFRTASRGRVKLHKNRAISPKKIVPSFRACPWGPFGKRGLEGGADKPVGDCRQNSVVWNWSGGRSENVGAQCGVRKPLLLVFREGPRGWQRLVSQCTLCCDSAVRLYVRWVWVDGLPAKCTNWRN